MKLHDRSTVELKPLIVNPTACKDATAWSKPCPRNEGTLTVVGTVGMGEGPGDVGRGDVGGVVATGDVGRGVVGRGVVGTGVVGTLAGMSATTR